ncbi:MAG: Gfo/Idh/MocA family oxidoreductase, partial [Planctomycetota bacterium]|nr:Gfo/Idh/MocA family oxidoreductase [Planctomycetota bacterium]
MPRKSTRRDFIKTSTALGTAFWVGGNTAWTQPASPLEKLNFACIGVDGKGSSDSQDAGSHGNIIGLCDIDDNRMLKKAAQFPMAEKFNDYAEMLDKLGDKIDAVTVSTPDHSHARASIMAMKLGKHCFCQKPLTWSVYEARKMREIAAEMKVVTQMGNQGTADNGFRESVEIIQAGTIGAVNEVHVWTNRPIWPQGTGRPTDTPPVPSNVHWDLFLGPAAERPYHPAYHPFAWRGWIDFGTGALGDMACHTANMAVMALDLFDPLTVEAETSGIVDDETFPKDSQITFEFGERGDRPPVKMVWYDGGKLPPKELLFGEEITSSGLLLIGEKGSLYTPNDYGAARLLLPKEEFTDFKMPEPTLPRSPGHFTEWVVACSGGGSLPMSNF